MHTALLAWRLLRAYTSLGNARSLYDTYKISAAIKKMLTLASFLSFMQRLLLDCTASPTRAFFNQKSYSILHPSSLFSFILILIYDFSLMSLANASGSLLDCYCFMWEFIFLSFHFHLILNISNVSGYLYKFKALLPSFPCKSTLLSFNKYFRISFCLYIFGTCSGLHSFWASCIGKYREPSCGCLWRHRYCCQNSRSSQKLQFV